MIEIAPGKWGCFDQIIFMQIKQLLKSFLLVPGSYYIKSYRTQALDIARLDLNQNIL